MHAFKLLRYGRMKQRTLPGSAAVWINYLNWECACGAMGKEVEERLTTRSEVESRWNRHRARKERVNEAVHAS